MDGSFCVDLFENPDGGFGFEHLRSDPEDHGRWTVIGGHGGLRHPTPGDAIDAAVAAVTWLTSEPAACNQIEGLRTRLAATGYA